MPHVPTSVFGLVLVSNGFPKQLVERANNKNSITSFSKALGTAIF